MAAKAGGWLLYCAFVVAIVFIGWNEPLRYRFLSRAEIDKIEHPTPPPPVVPAASAVPQTPKPGAWMSDPSRNTKLDGGARDNARSMYRPQGTPYPVPVR